MSESILLPDDPRLTAYALGELSPSERAEVERLLEHAPAARAEVDQIREVAVALAGELRLETAPGLNESQREAVVRACASSDAAIAPMGSHLANGRWKARFAAVSTVAAMIAVALVLNTLGNSTGTKERELARSIDSREFDEPAVQLAARIEKYQELYDQKRYDEALVLAREAKQAAPENPVADVMVLKARLAMQNDLDGDGVLDGQKAVALSEQLNDVDVAALSFSADSSFSDTDENRWKQLSVRRGKFKGVADQPVATNPADASRPSAGDQAQPSEGQKHYFGAISPTSQSDGRQFSAATSAPRSGKEAKPAAGRQGKGGELAQSGGGQQNAGIQSGKQAVTYSKSGKDARSSGVGEIQKGSGGYPGSGGGSQAPASRLLTTNESVPIDKLTPGFSAKAPLGAPGAPVAKLEDELLSQGVQRGSRASGATSRTIRAKAGQADDAPEDFAKSDPYLVKLKKGTGTVLFREGEAAPQGQKMLGEAKEDSGAQNESRSRMRTVVTRDGAVRYVVPETEGVSRAAWDPAPEAGFLYTAVPGTEQYDPIHENHFVSPRDEPLSTFGVDVDTASYSNARRFLKQGQWPPRNAVRVEEFVNYFSYDYPQPAADRPFSVNVEVGKCPWQPEHRLVRIGLKGKEIPKDKRPASNLVFLVDVSGSMADQNKLPLVKNGLLLLTEQMTEGDRVAIVTYSDTATVRLESTTGDKQPVIRDVINSLTAGGSTNGADGIQKAYDAAARSFLENGTNRVILCTDGDFNVGVTGDDELVKLIQERAKTKVFFSVFGFGMGNLKDGKLEKLADKGNGHYAYVDDDREARKVFVEELASNLITIAKDVKIQVEFNPATVGAYRLIGYENRALAAQDFQDDKKDAGEIGAGHTVTALYEILPADKVLVEAPNKALRYQTVLVPKNNETAGEMLTVKLRYKQPEGDASTLMEVPVKDMTAPSKPSPDFEWATAVAGFAMILRQSEHRGQAALNMVQELAQGAKGEDKSGRRAEFLELINRAKSLRPDLATPAARPTEPRDPSGATETPVRPLTREQAQQKATLNGKYRNLLRVLEVPGDAATYGEFRDYGSWPGTSYAGQTNLPAGYWVYVAPHWYIWGDAKE